jgi:hypothetical protein
MQTKMFFARSGSSWFFVFFKPFLAFLAIYWRTIYACLAFLDEMPTQISDIGIPTKSKMCSKPSLGWGKGAQHFRLGCKKKWWEKKQWVREAVREERGRDTKREREIDRVRERGGERERGSARSEKCKKRRRQRQK